MSTVDLFELTRLMIVFVDDVMTNQISMHFVEFMFVQLAMIVFIVRTKDLSDMTDQLALIAVGDT